MPLPTANTSAQDLATINFEVIAHSSEKLAEVLRNKWVTPEEVKQRQHYAFLLEYLGNTNDGLGAKTIVCEWPYVSQSYLEDYANYYARCFASYERKCKRVHFFAYSFTKEELLIALSADDKHPIWASYLGYIVIKPIPSPLGATLLRPYAEGQQGERAYSVKRPYQVNLLGKKLSIETLIWQQQDTNVSACATTALWVAFHKTAFLFQTPLPSPYRITESAGSPLNHSGRTFPNSGLDQYQVMTAVQSVGLVSEMRNQFADPQSLLDADKARQLRRATGFLYAYLRMGLPALLFIQIKALGGHLITVTGYRKPSQQFVYKDDVEDVTIDGAIYTHRHLTLLSDGIERAYVHDDGVGPYSRLGFEESTGLLITGWPDETGEWRRAILDAIAFPLTDDARIRYEQVYEQAAGLNSLLSFLRPIYASDASPIVWDIYLQYSNVHKQETLQSTDGTLAQRQRVVTWMLPKYIWVARVLYLGQPLMEFIFDATDLHTGFYCLTTTTYEPLRTALITDVSTEKSQIREVLQQLGKIKYFDLLLSDLDVTQPFTP